MRRHGAPLLLMIVSVTIGVLGQQWNSFGLLLLGFALFALTFPAVLYEVLVCRGS